MQASIIVMNIMTSTIGQGVNCGCACVQACGVREVVLVLGYLKDRIEVRTHIHTSTQAHKHTSTQTPPHSTHAQDDEHATKAANVLIDPMLTMYHHSPLTSLPEPEPLPPSPFMDPPQNNGHD